MFFTHESRLQVLCRQEINHVTRPDLENKIDAIDQCNENFDCQKSLETKQLKQQLDDLYESRTKGYQVRSPAKWVESGEKSTGYFLGLEKSRQSANCITCLRDAKMVYLRSQMTKDLM